MSGRRFPGWMPQIPALLFCTWLFALTHHAQGQKPPAGQSPQQTGNIRVKVGLVMYISPIQTWRGLKSRGCADEQSSNG